jgi:hypothetical protein
MNISKVICGVIALTLLADAALAEPNLPAPATAPLNVAVSVPTPTAPTKHKPQLLADAQMDKVTAGGLADWVASAVVGIVVKTVVDQTDTIGAMLQKAGIPR